jgi:hypothetical protein
MKLNDLMLTDEERRKLHGCRDTDKCKSSTYCESQCNLKGERAAIAHAVLKLDEEYGFSEVVACAMIQRPDDPYLALLAEAQKEVEG